MSGLLLMTSPRFQVFPVFDLFPPHTAGCWLPPTQTCVVGSRLALSSRAECSSALLGRCLTNPLTSCLLCIFPDVFLPISPLPSPTSSSSCPFSFLMLHLHPSIGRQHPFPIKEGCVTAQHGFISQAQSNHCPTVQTEESHSASLDFFFFFP